MIVKHMNLMQKGIYLMEKNKNPKPDEASTSGKYSEFDYDYLNTAASRQEMTGLIPSGLQDDEIDSYMEIYPFLGPLSKK